MVLNDIFLFFDMASVNQTGDISFLGRPGRPVCICLTKVGFCSEETCLYSHRVGLVVHEHTIEIENGHTQYQ